MKTKITRNYFIKKWLEALESGEYKKGKGQLKNRDRYCCLGVACDVANKLELFEKKIRFGNKGYLPDGLSKFLKISNLGTFNLGVLWNNSRYWSLARLNDGTGISLPEIAQIIKENLRSGNFEEV